jgi:hypothetical protein
MSEVTTDNPSKAPKERHGCLTTYLVFMIIVNSGVSLIYLFGSGWVRRNGPNAPDWAFWLLALTGLVNVLCAVALLRWKKWGFWGFVVSAIAIFIVNLSIGLGPSSGLGGAIGVALLYGVLQIGKERKGWPQLE